MNADELIMKFQSNTIIGVAITAMCVGFCISLFSWDGLVYYFEKETPRLPANIKKTFSLSKLKNRHSLKNNKENFLENSILLKKSKHALLEVGNFSLSKKNSFPSACNQYDTILITYSAFGMMNSHSTPELTIQTPCSPSQDGRLMSSVIIPTYEITQLDIKNKQLTLNDEQTIYFKFVYDEWPREWELNKIQFINSTNKKESLSFNFLGLANKLNLQFYQ